jgi:hypothetical protein
MRTPCDHEAFAVAIAAALLAAGCGGRSSAPGEGTAKATLSVRGATINVSVDGGDVYVILIDTAIQARISVLRVRGADVTSMPIATTTDWSDYLANTDIGVNPTSTALVSGGKGYFLGAYGVTIVPLDGSASATLYPPPLVPGAGHAYDVVGAFTVDAGSVYVCESDEATDSTNLARFDPDGTWEVLFAGTVPSINERCEGSTIAADADAVYWATSQAIRAYDKRDGTVRTIVDLEEGSPPWFLAVAGDTLAWFDTFDLSFHSASKTALTPHEPAALGATTLFHVDDAAPAPFSMFATTAGIYWLSPFELHRQAFTDGTDEALAQRSVGGSYLGLATDGKDIYFTDTNVPGDGGLGTVVLRSVPQ